MKIGIHTLGTRGDVQPYLALAGALQAAGHEALLVAPAQFARMAADRGIAFAALPAAFLDLMQEPEVAALLGGGRVGPMALRAILARYRPVLRGVLDAEAAAARAFRPDLIVHHPKALGAPWIAAHMGRSSVLASPLPGFTPTAAFPSPVLPFRSLGPLNRASHLLAMHSAGFLFGGMLREWRRQAFGVTRDVAPRSAATLYAYSSSVLAVPPEWRGNPRVLVSGYWFLDEPAWQPPPDLQEFLRAGSPPVYVGFGSMPLAGQGALMQSVIEALERCKVRGLLMGAGWAQGPGLRGQLPGHMHVLEQAPHDRLFPHMAAIVHHGGAGTTAAALRAGRPSVVCPFFGDQPFWGRTVAALGAGPEPLPVRAITPAALATRVQQALQPAPQRRCEAIAARISAERGLDAAVRFLEELRPG